MENKIPFKVRDITTIKDTGVVVFVKTLSKIEFIIKPGLKLNGCEIKGGDIPRLLDKSGKARTDVWGLWLKNPNDEIHFKIGDTVELSQ